MEQRAFTIGCRVVFFDTQRVAHEAIVTNWFHAGPNGETLEQYRKRHAPDQEFNPGYDAMSLPCCNVVFVSSDEAKQDPYGRQLERASSVGYGRQGAVPFVGYGWAWPDEAEEAKRLAAVAFQEAVAK